MIEYEFKFSYLVSYLGYILVKNSNHVTVSKYGY